MIEGYEKSKKATASILQAYLEVTKPPSVALLVFTALGGMVVAAGGQAIPPGLFLQALLAAILGCAGANTITCYIDRDIDSIMERTKRRPLPTKRIDPPERALYWGVALTIASFILAWLINPLSFLCAAFGFFDNVLVYSLLMKRRSPLNVVWGGFSGGIPALFGWAAVKGSLSLAAFLIAALVVLWIPSHIWNLALFWSEDYKKVKVPMLPAVFTLKSTLRCLLTTILLLYLFSIALGFVGGLGTIYLTTALVAGLAMVVGNLYMFIKPTRKKAWVMFKMSGPYLLILFVSMMLDLLLK